MPIQITPFLRTVLKLDAVFGAVATVMFIAGAGFIAGLTGLPERLLFWAGVTLLPYTALLVAVARRESVPRIVMIDLVLINAAWAVVSLGLLATGAIAPNGLGVAMDIVQAVAVAGFGALYVAALKQVTSPRAAP